MTVTLVDTCVWSLALRRSRQADHPAVALLQGLAGAGEAAIIGPIRQELLSGVRQAEDFQRLRRALRAFPDVALETDDFEHAATLCSACMRAGVQGSSTDFLICAVTMRRRFPLLTTDLDFARYADLIPIRLAL